MMLSAMLEGAFDQGLQYMRTDLPAHGLLPAGEPYTALGWTLPGSGGQTTDLQYASTYVDWVLVELRDALQPSIVVATMPALIDRLGSLRTADPFMHIDLPAQPGAYYVAIRHRNHLGVMTATPIELSTGLTTLDFIDPATPTYGTDARRIIGNKAMLWAGNAKREGSGPQQIKYMGANNDRDPILARIGGSVPTSIANGYYAEDIDLDGAVKYTGLHNDRDIILQGVGGSVPTAMRAEQVP